MKENHNILLICRSYGIDSPQPIRFKYLSKEISRNNKIHLLRFSRKDSSDPGPEKHFASVTTIRYSALSQIFRRDESGGGTSIISEKRRMNPAFKRSIKIFIRFFLFPDNFILEYRRLLKATRTIINENEIDTVIASSQPFTVLKLSDRLKREGKIKCFLFDTGDPLFGNSEICGNRILSMMAHRFERKFLKHVDRLIVPTDVMSGMYLDNYDKIINADKLSVIPQGYSKELYGRIEWQHQGDNKGKIRIIYAGRFYNGLREPFKIYNAFKDVDNVILDIYGKIGKEFIPNAKNIFYRGLVGHERIIKLTDEADAILFIDNKFGYQVPGKIYEVIASGKPVLFVYDNHESPSMDIIRKYPAAIIVENGIEPLREVLLNLEKLISEIKSFDYPFEDYSWQTLGKKYNEIIRELR